MHEVQMEKYEFVGHNEDQAIEDIDLHELQQYVNQCNVLAEKIAESVGEKAFQKGETSSEAVHRIVNTTVSDSQTLLNLLINLYKSVFDENGNPVNNAKVNELIVRRILMTARTSDEQRSQYDLALDRMNAIQSNERLLRSLLDIVNENGQRNISIAEVNPSSSVLAPAILHNMGFYFHYPLVVDYSVVTPDLKSLPQDIQESGYQFLEWDTSKTNLPTLSAPVDLLIYKDSANDLTEVNFESLCAQLANNVRDNGFLLAVFRSRFSAAETLIAHLSGKASLVSDCHSIISSTLQINKSQVKR